MGRGPCAGGGEGPPLGWPALLWAWLVRKGSTAGWVDTRLLSLVPSLSDLLASPALGPHPELLIHSTSVLRGGAAHTTPRAHSPCLGTPAWPERHSHFCADFLHSGGPGLQARGMRGISDFSCGKKVGEGFTSPARILCKITFCFFFLSMERGGLRDLAVLIAADAGACRSPAARFDVNRFPVYSSFPWIRSSESCSLFRF